MRSRADRRGLDNATGPRPARAPGGRCARVDLRRRRARSVDPRDAGLVRSSPTTREYAAANDEAAPFNLMTGRASNRRALPAPAAPPTDAPPGITRTTLIDNGDVRVVRVRFAPGGREPVHTHPNDLLTVQLTPGTFDIVGRTRHDRRCRTAGFVQFLPRDVPHAYISADSRQFELLSISIK